jgi:serine/threonine protein kinase
MNEEDLLEMALGRPPAERSAFLKQACGDDFALRQRIEELLQAHEQPRDLPRQPTVTRETSDVPPGRWIDPNAINPSPETVGSRLGSYKLMQKIGEGGMGTVWMAEQAKPVQRRVAIKVIKSGMDSAETLARFEQERQALALMDHPNIARVFDAGTLAEGRPYFVMELVKGVPITKYCDQEHLTPRERLELFVPVCLAVQHAHQKGIIHRDIKPSNVLIALYDGKPVPKVIDFGVAKAIGQKLTEKTFFTEIGQIVGTVEYMSPEQAELNNLDIDTRADIYSLGVLLYELLTGSPPFTRVELRSAAFAEMLRIIREVEPAKPSTKLSCSEELAAIAAKRKLEPKRLARLVYGELDWIVMKCLEKERARRYETANGLALDIQRYLADEPVLAGPPSMRYRIGKFVRRNRGPVVAAILVFLALVGGILGTTLGLLRAGSALRAEEEQRRVAESNAKEATRQKRIAEDERREMELQAAIARAVNDFLQNDLLSQADVNRQTLGQSVESDPDVKVLTLLDRSARTIVGKFKDQPLTEAAIRFTIGEAYLALGRFEEARPHLERSAQLRTDELGRGHQDTLAVKNTLGLLYKNQGKCELAEVLLKETLELSTVKLALDHPLSISVKNNLAVLYQTQAKYDRAEPLLQEVLTINKAKLGNNHSQTLTSKNNLAVLYQAKGDYERSESLLKELLQASEDNKTIPPLQILIGKNNLATLYQSQGNYDRAEPLFKEVLGAFQTKLGDDHPDTLTAKFNLAGLYQAQGDYERAEVMLKEVVQKRTIKLGAGHPDTLTSKHNLAGLYQSQEKYGLAEKIYLEVLHTFSINRGINDLHTLIIKSDLSQLYLAQGNFIPAESMCKETLLAFTTKLGANHPHTLTCKHNLAIIYWRLKRWNESIPLFEDVLRVQKSRLDPSHPDTLLALASLGCNYRDVGRIEEAISLLEQAVRRAGGRSHGLPRKLAWIPYELAQTYDRVQRFDDSEPIYRSIVDRARIDFGDGHPETAARMSLLGQNLIRQKKYAEAESILSDSLAIFEKKKVEAWHTFNTRSMLGETLVNRKKFTEAEPLLLRGYQAMKAVEGLVPPHERIRLIEAVERIVRLYEAWGNKEKTYEWRKVLDESRKTTPNHANEKKT